MSVRRRPSSFRVMNRRTSVLRCSQSVDARKVEDEGYEHLCKQLDPNSSQAALIRALNSVYELSGGDINNGNPRDSTRDDLDRKGIVASIVSLLDVCAVAHPNLIKTCCKVLRNMARNDTINESLGDKHNLCIRVLSLFDNQLNPPDAGQQRFVRCIEAIVSLIHNLSRNHTNANNMLDNGVVRLILQAMKENNRSSTIAEHCCATFYYLMQHADSIPSAEMTNEISIVIKESVKIHAMYRNVSHFGSIVLKYLTTGSIVPVERKPKPTAFINASRRATVFNGNINSTNIKTSTDTKDTTAKEHQSGARSKSDKVVKSSSLPRRFDPEENQRNPGDPTRDNAIITKIDNDNKVSNNLQKGTNAPLPEITRRFTRGHLVPFPLPENQGTAFIKSRPGLKPSFTDERQARAVRSVRINYKHLAVPEHIELMLA